MKLQSCIIQSEPNQVIASQSPSLPKPTISIPLSPPTKPLTISIISLVVLQNFNIHLLLSFVLCEQVLVQNAAEQQLLETFGLQNILVVVEGDSTLPPVGGANASMVSVLVVCRCMSVCTELH